MTRAGLIVLLLYTTVEVVVLSRPSPPQSPIPPSFGGFVPVNTPSQGGSQN